jgi:hypothetical protein
MDGAQKVLLEVVRDLGPRAADEGPCKHACRGQYFALPAGQRLRLGFILSEFNVLNSKLNVHYLATQPVPCQPRQADPASTTRSPATNAHVRTASLQQVTSEPMTRTLTA